MQKMLNTLIVALSLLSNFLLVTHAYSSDAKINGDIISFYASDLISVSKAATNTDGSHSVEILLTKDQAIQLSNFTGQNIGRFMTIEFMDKIVAKGIEIQSAISMQKIHASVPTNAQVEDLIKEFKAIKTTPKPDKIVIKMTIELD